MYDKTWLPKEQVLGCGCMHDIRTGVLYTNCYCSGKTSSSSSFAIADKELSGKGSFVCNVLLGELIGITPLGRRLSFICAS